MNNLSKKETTLIFTPIVSGALFISTVLLNHALFDNNIITARQAIGHEMLFFLTGSIATIIQSPFAVRWFFKRHWHPASLCLVSIVAFWASIMFGGSQGAAMFYAT